MGLSEDALPMGIWCGFYFPDDNDYATIKKMKHPMFSLFGKATRELVEDINKGLGRMGGPLVAGPDGICICPNCGTKVDHKTGTPCSDISCPKCGTKMTRKEDK